MERFYNPTFDVDSPFAEKLERKRFVSKVFAVVALMLVPPFFMAFLPHMSEPIQTGIYENSIIIGITGAVVYAACSCWIFCCRCLRQCWLALVLLSLSISLVVAVISARYRVLVPGMAVGVTLGVVLLVGLLAKYGPWDVTGCTMLAIILGILTILFSIAVLIVSLIVYIPILHFVLCLVVCLVFVFFLWMDLQLIMGGGRQQLGTDDYVLAAAMLFSDIIIIFIHVLQLIGGTSD